MNRTKIEWTDYTWNPLTGCSLRCSYCYAWKMAKRLRGQFGYPWDNPFKVTFHPERLKEPCEVKKPSKIFVCSMGELFDEESHYGWIGLIFGVMRRCPQHTFQILTKQSQVLPQFDFPENCWVGVTVTRQANTWRIDDLKEAEAKIRFVSFEPLLGHIEPDLNGIQWVIVGKLTGSRKVKLKNDWLIEIREACRFYKVPLFEKNNLGLENPRQEFPTWSY